ncbi:hypothetical protein GWI33_012879 [Rhynchophorus ferrugineus]|uniref:Uncharacterized protein n=1 Tax=Rhynchophorus ferrugineus TaxID=354439 RepID=A0A834MDR9_RHYFE|nr:hypothetical protein GWI33_012879 [Rhynchophorus ferrugineus]
METNSGSSCRSPGIVVLCDDMPRDFIRSDREVDADRFGYGLSAGWRPKRGVGWGSVMKTPPRIEINGSFYGRHRARLSSGLINYAVVCGHGN